MSCPGCEIHAAIHSVVKNKSVRPKDEAIPTSSKKSARPVVAAQVVDEKGDGTIPLPRMLDGSDDGSPT